MDPLSQGREYYLNKDYKAALKVLTEVVHASTDYIRLTALDHRAATFAKLGELQPALKDARDMIFLKPGRAKGYLRCGKVLLLSGKEALAMQIYERGLSKVKIGEDTDRPLLQQMYTKLQQRQKPSRNLDPLVALPNELALMVFSFLDMRDRVICLAVSRPWKRFLESSRGLWTTLDLRYVRRSVRKDALKAYLRRSNYGVDRAYFNTSFSVFSTGKLEMITQTCKRLKHLECSSNQYNSHLGVSLLSALPEATDLRILIIKDCSILFSQISKVVSICPLLEHVEFHNIKTNSKMLPTEWLQLGNLVTLLLKADIGKHFVRTLNMDKLIASTPNLRSLTLSNSGLTEHRLVYPLVVDLARWTQLERLEFISAHLEGLPTFPPTLKYLDMSENYKVPYDLEPMEFNLPLLETFICDENLGFSLDLTSRIIHSSIKNGNLKTLRMSDQCPTLVGPLDLQAFAAPSLIELSLRGWQIPEVHLIAYLRVFPALKYVDLSTTKVTGVAIKELMTRESGPLKWLGLNGCLKLSSDAVDYARGLGCTVEHSSWSQSYEVKSIRDRMTMSGL